MKEKLFSILKDTVADLGISSDHLKLDYSDNLAHGDFTTNIAMVGAKIMNTKSIELANNLVERLKDKNIDFIESIGVAGGGFINFKIKVLNIAEEIVEISRGNKKGNDSRQTIMVEYTDPNPFKEFHIGHLMSNAIGESISRIIEYRGNKVVRANWQGDIGPHVAKAIWGALHYNDEDKREGASFWGKAYVIGARAYENPDTKKEIDEINAKIYSRSDTQINELYDRGRKESLESFEKIYEKLGTKFDNYFFESKEGMNGESVVRDYLNKGVFEESEGAIIFRGEKYGLHTRVFINSQGLPTYETKEIGLNIEKFKLYPDLERSIIVTANEQSDYFKVLLKVFELVKPDIAKKTKHISHGMMRFASGKMGSRKGNVITGESLIKDIEALVLEKIKDRDFDSSLKKEIASTVAVGAIKYTILRQAIGGNIIFDSAKSISFEGDSGPYLQYSAVRAQSILAKAGDKGSNSFDISNTKQLPKEVSELERLLIRFDDIVARSEHEYAPHHIANYLTILASAFNSFYASNTIIDDKNELSAYRVLLTKAFLNTMKSGLWLLGIKIPSRM